MGLHFSNIFRNLFLFTFVLKCYLHLYLKFFNLIYLPILTNFKNGRQTTPQTHKLRFLHQSLLIYRLYKMFSIMPKFDGNHKFLNTFIKSWTFISNLINCKNPHTWQDIKVHLKNYRDLNYLIADLQRMQQLSGECPLTFIAKLQTHEAKMIFVINKQFLTIGLKTAQWQLFQSMSQHNFIQFKT